MKLVMPVQHLLIDSELQQKFIELLDLLRSGGKSHMTNVLLIIRNPIVNLNYQKLVETLFSIQVANKEKFLML